MPKPPGKLPKSPPKSSKSSLHRRPYTPQRLLSLAVHHEVRRRTQALSAFKDATHPAAEAPGGAAAHGGRARHLARGLCPPAERALDDNHRVPALERDYSRIVHSSALRRLQGKTQLIPAGENEVFRTRLTVSAGGVGHRLAHRAGAQPAAWQAARRLPRQWPHRGLRQPAARPRHPPFGPLGRGGVLNERMLAYGGFEGKCADPAHRGAAGEPPGLIGDRDAAELAIAGTDKRRGHELTAGTLAAVVGTPICCSPGPGAGAKGVYAEDLRSSSSACGAGLEWGTVQRIGECQIMDIADDIAYWPMTRRHAGGRHVTPLDLVAPDDELLASIRCGTVCALPGPCWPTTSRPPTRASSRR